ncbi:MAG: hypothetical protein IJN42_04835 [Clostridia bacterium]|nr:hypothetical protein [Clostridia bacterium]
MVKVIIGKKGTGKTKALIDMVNQETKESAGNVVCIEYGDKLKLDISSKARLIDIKSYDICGIEALEGFILGLFAGNYDITSVYVDSILKIIGEDLDALGKLLNELDKFTEASKTSVTVMVSAEPADAPESVVKFM